MSEVIKLRPFAGWVDLVTKLQQSRFGEKRPESVTQILILFRGLSTEMLNSATELLRMKSAVTKLMNKCQKITAKMEGLVDFLQMSFFIIIF